MDGLLQKLMNGTKTVFKRPELATGIMLAALMVVAVKSQEETDG